MSEKIVERTPQEVHDNIVELLKEIQQLKLDYELYKDNHIYKNYEVETKDNTIKQLKEVIEEVREKLKLQRKVALSLKHPYTVSNIDEVLQILNKVGDDNEQ